MCCRVVLFCCSVVRYRIGSEVSGRIHEHSRLTIFGPGGFSCWQSLLRESGIGILLTADVCFVSEVALHEPRVLLDVLEHDGERCVLVQTLDEELGVCVQRPATLLGLDGRERSFDAAEDPTFTCTAVSEEVLTWRVMVGIVAVRTVRAHLNTEQVLQRQPHDHVEPVDARHGVAGERGNSFLVG